MLKVRLPSTASLISFCRSGFLPILALSLIAFLTVGTPIYGQDGVTTAFLPQGNVEEKPYALLFVTVWGPDNRPVYGVKVRIRRVEQKKPRWEVYSDRRGEAAQRLPPGPADYVVSADPKGVKDVNGKNLRPGDEATVHFDKEERQDVGLHLK
jgi:hypothetical protein